MTRDITDPLSSDPTPRLVAFLDALPHAGDDEFVNAPGVGTFRAKHIRRGLERGVVAVHHTGYGLCLVQPREHGICRECSARNDKRTICDHCNCTLCSWFRMTEERGGAHVSQERMKQLVARMQAFRFASAPAAVASTPELDGDL